MSKKTHFVLLVFLLGSGSLLSQEIVFEDYFEDNQMSWGLVENDTRTVAIKDGKLIVRDNPEIAGTTYTVKSVFFDPDEDFEIELLQRQIGGKESFANGLVFGLLDNQNFYNFSVAATQYFRLQKCANGQYIDLIPWTYVPNVVSPIGKENKLLLRKSGSTIKLYVNGKFVGSKPFEPFFGQNVGVWAEDNTAEYDHLIVRLGTSAGAAQVTTNVVAKESTRISDVDQSIPISKSRNDDAIAVVIGNTEYAKTKKVNFAVSDASSVRTYLTKTMGFKEGNILYVENATKGDFELLFGTKDNHQGKLANTIKQGLSDVFVFYSGHGAPGLKDQKGYFVPVECDPNYVELTGYPSEIFYNNLSKIGAKSVTVVLDACFSGATIFENISPILIKEKPETINENILVLSSSSGSEVSSWYNDQSHGMFTYFFLKSIQDHKTVDTNADRKLTAGEIYQYISDNNDGVPYWARRIHGIEQHPTLSGINKDRVIIEY